MIEPYVAVALSPHTVACDSRSDVMRNMRNVAEFVELAYGVAATEGPRPRLLALPEWCLQGPLLNFHQGDRRRERELAVEIPGPEVEVLAEKARALDAYIAAELYLVRDDDFPDRYFNVAFIVAPSGEVVYRRAKTQVADYEPHQMGTTCPHDVWDRWVEVKGGGNPMDALYPVLETEIGNIGIVICMEGGYPEVARGLAMNGAEILVRMTYQDPYVSNGWWELQNRAHAMFNNAYVVAPNVGPQYMRPGGPPVDVCGGRSMIVDYTGRVLVVRDLAASDTMVSTTIDVEALRRFRAQPGFGNNLKDLRTEQFAAIYAEPVYPKNRYLDEPPGEGALEREQEARRQTIATLSQRGTFQAPDGAPAPAGAAAAR